MAAPTTWPAADWSLPLPDPEVYEGCEDCRRLARLRTLARLSDNRSAASDANVLMRKHQQKRH